MGLPAGEAKDAKKSAVGGGLSSASLGERIDCLDSPTWARKIDGETVTCGTLADVLEKAGDQGLCEGITACPMACDPSCRSAATLHETTAGSLTEASSTGGAATRLLMAKPKSSKKKKNCLLYTSPSPRDGLLSRMPSSA